LTLFPVFVGSKPSRAHSQCITFILWLGGIAYRASNFGMASMTDPKAQLIKGVSDVGGDHRRYRE
jgi:hypothetical protein